MAQKIEAGHQSALNGQQLFAQKAYNGALIFCIDLEPTRFSRRSYVLPDDFSTR